MANRARAVAAILAGLALANLLIPALMWTVIGALTTFLTDDAPWAYALLTGPLALVACGTAVAAVVALWKRPGLASRLFAASTALALAVVPTLQRPDGGLDEAALTPALTAVLLAFAGAAAWSAGRTPAAQHWLPVPDS